MISQNILKRYGAWGIKLKSNKADFAKLKKKTFIRFSVMILSSLLFLYIIYNWLWVSNQGAEWIVSIIQKINQTDYYSSLGIYVKFFRDYKTIIIIAYIITAVFIVFVFFINWFMNYLSIINNGIEALLSNRNDDLALPTELVVFERKLNTVKQTLKQREFDAQLAEQRKNELVMYLAHDIRTPLTSVIGYLSLLDEAPDMPLEQKAKYVHITLDKAYRLEKMINEFFEITRYNLQQIILMNETIDLYYMLVQLSDELSPILSKNGNTAILNADEEAKIYGDPDKLARVFNNVLKNAAAYCYPNTEIIITAKEIDGFMNITFQNKGKTIPENKLNAIFDKFLRLDEARTSNTGGAGLGLAIAKEIVTLHGGTIVATSISETTTFTITIPIKKS